MSTSPSVTAATPSQSPAPIPTTTAAPAVDDKFEVRCLVDNTAVGGLIGKGGVNVKQVRDETGTVVIIVKNDAQYPTERIMLLKGQIAQIGQAIKQLTGFMLSANAASSTSNNATAAVSGTNGNANSVTLRILVQKTQVGAVIGKEGVTIKNISSSTNARLSVSNDVLLNSTEKAISITGQPAEIEAAALKILQLIKENPIKPLIKVHNYHPNSHHNSNHGPSRSQNASNPNQQQGARFPRRSGAPGGGASPAPSSFSAPAASAPAASTPGAVGAAAVPAEQTSTQKIAIPTICAGCVIGKNGTVIRDLRTQSNTSISIANPASNTPNERVVTLTGAPEGIRTAVYLIRQLVEQYQPNQQ